MHLSEQSTVLSSWKDIARYVGKGVRTVQRWEHELGLPVRRPNGVSQKSSVVLYRADLDLWLETRFSARAHGKVSVSETENTSRMCRAELRDSIGKARELRSANMLLAQQVSQSLQRLSALCEVLASVSTRVPVPSSRKPVVAPSLAAEATLVVTRSELAV